MDPNNTPIVLIVMEEKWIVYLVISMYSLLTWFGWGWEAFFFIIPVIMSHLFWKKKKKNKFILDLNVPFANEFLRGTLNNTHLYFVSMITLVCYITDRIAQA